MKNFLFASNTNSKLSFNVRNFVLSTIMVVISTLFVSVIAQDLGTFEVLSVDHSQGNIGKYFNFNVEEVDKIIGNEDWGGTTIQIRNDETGHISQAILWRSRNGGSVGDGHGRWDDGTASPGQWRVGDSITILEDSIIAALNWYERGAHDKGCFDNVQTYHVRCEDPNGQWSTACTDMPRGNFKGKPMLVDPIRLPDRAWTEVKVQCENPSAFSWYERGAHDKGCSDNVQTYHVRCEDPNGQWSTACTDMPRGNFKSKPMLIDPIRLPDRAWTEVKVQCKSPSAFSWYERGAHDKGCWNNVQTYHVRCEDPNGQWSTACTDMPRGNFKGKPMLNNPKRLSDRAWTEVQTQCF